MFTGLIQCVGQIQKMVINSSGVEFFVGCNKVVGEIRTDDSIAINGVCLTATKIEAEGFWSQAVHITLEKTNLGQLKIGSPVNVELAMKASDRIGGHFVTGHVNTKTKLNRTESKGDNFEMWFQLTSDIRFHLIKEGSVALNGISLTVAEVLQDEFMVSIIPHTWAHTQISKVQVGDEVNVELDMMAKMVAKYVENYLKIQRENHAQI